MRGLKVLVAVMSAALVAGTIALIVAIVHRTGGSGREMAPVTLDEPPGTHIEAASTGGDRLAVQLQGGGPDRVIVIDLRSGQIAARVGLAR